MNLYYQFNSNFEIVYANTSHLLYEAHSLRHQIYCWERGLEEPTPNGTERDQYDKRSQHCLIRHRDSDEFVGVVRLIMPNSQDLTERFPVEDHCQKAVNWSSINPKLPSRRRLGEVSRFSLSRNLERLAEGHEGTTLSRSRLQHNTLVGLIAAVIGLTCQSGITHFYAMMEPALVKLLARFGVPCHSIGQVVEYRGQRVPTLGSIPDITSSICSDHPDTWKIVAETAGLQNVVGLQSPQYGEANPKMPSSLSA